MMPSRRKTGRRGGSCQGEGWGLRWRYFFFSSRRRHTRFDCDWSSDVCSSDLLAFVLPPLGGFGIIYLVTAGLLGLGVILVDLRLVANPTKAQAWTAFKFSSPYLDRKSVV